MKTIDFWDMTKTEYSCDKCDKVFSEKRKLAAHQKVHDPVEQCKYCHEDVMRIKLHESRCPKNPIHYKECKNCGKQIIKKYLSQLKGVDYCSRRCGEIGRSMTYEECKEAVSKLTYFKDLQNTSLREVMKRNGWWDDLTSGLIRMRNEDGFSKEEIQKEALKYKIRNDFRTKSYGYYYFARKYGIIEEVCKHMGIALNKKQYTKKEILESAKKYTNQTDWRENEPSVFTCWECHNKPNQSKENKKFYKECISHMEYIFKPNGYWTKERCREVADKYTDIRIFQRDDWEAYKVIKREGWWDEMCSDMIWTTFNGNVRYPDGYVWSLEDAKIESKKYKLRGEVGKKCPSLYRQVKENGWEDICYKHMKIPMGLAFRHIYAEVFPNHNTVYIGLSCEIERRHNAHLGKEKAYGVINSPVYKFMKKVGEKPQLKILTRRPVKSENAGGREDYYKNKYKEEGWNLLNTAKTGKGSSSLGAMHPKWNYKKFEKIKNECKTKEEFHHKLNSWQRSVAMDNNWWDKLISDLPFDKDNKLGRIPGSRWTLGEAMECGRRFKNANEFQKNYSGAYKRVLKEGGRELLRELYPGMKTVYKYKKQSKEHNFF